MRTEQQLRSALDELADTAPHPTRIRLEAPPAHRRRGGALVAALSVVVALVVLVPVVITRSTAEPADRRAAGDWTMISRVDPPVGWRITLRAVSGTYETVSLSRSGSVPGEPSVLCQVLTYGRGEVPPSVRQGGEPVDVAGRAGRWLSATETSTGRLTWSYADDAYVVVSCTDSGTLDDALALAGATRFDVATDLRLPFRLTALPPGYRVTSVFESMGDGTDGGLQAASSDPSLPGFTVTVPLKTFYDANSTGVERTTVNGYPATVWDGEHGGEHAVQLSVGTRYPLVTSLAVRAPQPGERDRIVQVARDLRFPPDLSDPSTWYTADRALP